MKTKYERMSKEEKRELYSNFKKEKKSLAKKTKNMFILCYVGIIYSIGVFSYDFFIKKSIPSYVMDIIVFIVSLIALYIVNNTKKNFLNVYALKKDIERKKKIGK